jgi:hypothetical protein
VKQCRSERTENKKNLMIESTKPKTTNQNTITVEKNPHFTATS